jgi:cell division protein FtsB
VYQAHQGSRKQGVAVARQNTHKTKYEVTPAGSSGARVIDIEEAQRLRRERRMAIARKRRRAEKPTEAEIAVATETARRSWISGKRIVYILISIAILAMGGASGLHILDLQAESRDAEAALQQQLELKGKLEEELSLVSDPSYIETQARERLRMIKGGETLYVFDEPEEDNSQ